MKRLRTSRGGLPALGAIILAALLAGAPALRAQADEWGDEWGDEEDAAVLEGTVEGARPRQASPGDQRSLEGASSSTATPEEGLEALAGVHLLRTGGPLAPVRLRYRGLEGPRLGSDLMGLRLADPVTGGLDVAALPLWALPAAAASSRAGSGAGGVHFEAPKGNDLKARAGAGTLGTFRLDAVATRDDGASLLSAGASLAMTEGDFRYAPASATGSVDDAAPLTRGNNDQRRASGLLHARTWIPVGKLDALAWGSAHEGGVPGFATAPTSRLRGRHLGGGARGAMTLAYGPLSAELDGAVTGSARSTWDELRPAKEGVASLSTSVGLGAEAEEILPGLTLAGAVRLERAQVLEADFVRDVGDVSAELEQQLGGRWLLLFARVGVTSFSDVGLLPRGEAGLEIGPSSSWAAGLRASHGGRAPTLDELYAPRGFVLGNSALGFERSSDAELYARIASAARGRRVEARVAAFVGRMEDMILFVNRNAFEVQPVNTGPLLRAGVEGRVDVQLHPLLGLEVTANALASTVEATGAPLPVVPPLSSRLVARLGEPDGGTLSVVVRQRSGVSNNLYGTLRTPGYALLDLVSRLPLGDTLAVTAALTNALDVLDARDVNLLPLPGRQLFVAVEVRT